MSELCKKKKKKNWCSGPISGCVPCDVIGGLPTIRQVHRAEMWPKTNQKDHIFINKKHFSLLKINDYITFNKKTK